MAVQYLPASSVLLAVDNGVPVGFAATIHATLAALFVLPSQWRKGIGKKLLGHLFATHQALELAVYHKNRRGIAFYRCMGFIPFRNQVCPHTGEREMLMSWKRT